MQDIQNTPQDKKSFLSSKITRRLGILAVSFALAFNITYTVPPPKQADAFFGSWVLVVKEYGLDGVAKFIAKRMLQMITRDTVNWISSGFQGSPGFVTNPERFALQIGDAAFNEFLTSDALNTLCSPFRVNIQLALRRQYIGDIYYRCTLDDVGVNLDRFYDDFGNGGWQGWFAVTQNSAHMPFGAYLEAQNDLYARIGSRQNTWQRKQDWGNGFLSWDVCTAKSEEEFQVPVIDQKTGIPTGEMRTQTRPSTPAECPPGALETRTPGSIIQNQLVNVFGSGIAELGVADEINEIIGALLDQFTIKLFNSAQGLFGMNGKISADPGRVISQVNVSTVLEPEDPDLANYCGSFREGFYPTASLEVSGDATFTTNRNDVTVVPGDIVTYSWCGANANQYASAYTIRRDLSSSSCVDTGVNVPWIAQNAYGAQEATVSSIQNGCAYEITYAARNTGVVDELTGQLTTETAESKIIVRVGETNPVSNASQCTISEVTPENLSQTATQLEQETSATATLSGGYITLSSSNGSVDLYPVSPSAVSDSIQAQVASQIGCTSTSELTFVVFQVSNPNALPPEMLAQLGDERPNQILVVLGQ